ncbi:MAG: hypothetical protein V7785_13630 [Bermanella sp.]
MKRKHSWLMLVVLVGTLIYGYMQSGYSLIATNQLDTPVKILNIENPPLDNRVVTSAQLIKVAAKKSNTHVNNKFVSNQQTSLERLRRQINKTDLQQNVLTEHDSFQRYPPQNHPIESAQQDPVTQRYDVDERTTMNDEKTMGITIWSNEKYYLANDSVKISAYLQDAQGQKIAGQFSARLVSTQGDTLAKFSLNDIDNSQIYQNVFELNSDNSQSHTPGIYKVIIEEDNSQIRDSVTFTLSQPDIQLTGEYRDKISAKGDLQIEAQVEVSQDNKFYVQASLYSNTRIPVGVTQFSQQMKAGKHWITLNFSGLMIQDAQESGPYVLQQISLAKVTMPMQRAPLVKPGYQTDSYGLDEFSSQAYQP